jgi:hypothetical protein
VVAAAQRRQRLGSQQAVRVGDDAEDEFGRHERSLRVLG